MAEPTEIDHETRERIFQEELARRATRNSRWTTFRRLPWYWQAAAWAVAWPVPLALLAIHRPPGHRRWIGAAAAAAGVVWLMVAISPVVPADEVPSANVAASSARSPSPTSVTTASTAAPTTTMPPAPTSTTAPPPPTTVPPTTVAQAVVAAPRMPDVVCMDLQDAQDEIQRHGVFFSRSEDATGAGRMQLIDSNWVVVAQRPAPGSAFGEGDAVLSVVKYGEVSGC